MVATAEATPPPPIPARDRKPNKEILCEQEAQPIFPTDIKTRKTGRLYL
jgi:hypothetical protein